MGVRIGKALAKIGIAAAVIFAVMVIFNVPNVHAGVKIGILFVGAAIVSVIGELR